jgi:hypothetical protein
MVSRIGDVFVRKSDWLVPLGDNQEVTIWLRSGRQVSGAIVDQFPANTRDATVFRIKEAPSVPSGVSSLQAPSASGQQGNYVLVSVSDIETIDYTDSKPGTANSSPTTT